MITTSQKNTISGENRPYLIIGGTTKAATTSLFAYLGAHPQVCPSTLKETRFFLDRDYPLDSKYRFEDGMDKYLGLFPECGANTRLWVEATPDYLYSKGTPQKVHSTLPYSKFVFILREPAARVISWYRFAKQENLLPGTMPLDEYIDLQLNVKDDLERHPQYMRSVEQGRYAMYLRPYYEMFGKERIIVIFLEELAGNPLKIVQDLCNTADIDPVFYDSYKFEVFNRTEDLKNPKIQGYYRRSLFHLRNIVYNHPTIKSYLRKIRLAIEPIYIRLNRRSSSPEINISAKADRALSSYYHLANQELESLLGRPLPWG